MDSREYNRMYSREVRQWHKKHGICVVCGQEDAEPGKTLCAECAGKNAAQGRNHWRSISAEERQKIIQRKVEQKRARREQRKSMGLCVVCGKRKAIKGKKHCLECLLKARRANRAQYDAKRVKTNFSEGLCCKCNDPVVPGKKVCARHYDIARRSMEAARKNLSSTKHPWKKDNRWIFKKKKPAHNSSYRWR